MIKNQVFELVSNLQQKVIIGLFLIIWSASGNVLWGQLNSANSFQYEFVIVQKMLADELYLEGQPDSALVAYENAEQSLLGLTVQGTEIDPTLVDLLQKEIEYRKMLIKNDLDFWGIEFSLKPQNPIIAYEELKELVEQLEETYQGIEELYNILDTDKDIIDEVSLKKEWNDYHVEVNEVDEKRLELLQDFERKVIFEAESQVASFIDRQKMLDNQSKENLRAIEDTQDNLNKGIMDAFVQASGMPTEFNAIDPDRSIEDNLKNVGTAMLSNSSSPLYNEFGKLSSSLNQARLLYENADSLYNRYKSAEKMLKNVHQLIRQPTFESFVEIGKQVYSELDPQIQDEIKEAVYKSKPVQVLFELSEQNKKIKQAIVHELKNQMKSTGEFKNILLELVDNYEQQAHEIFQNIVIHVSGLELNLNAKKEILDIIVKNWPKTFLRDCSPSTINILKKQFKVPTEEELRQKLSEAGLKNIPNFQLKDGHIWLDNQDSGINLIDILSIPKTKEIESASNQIKGELKNLIKELYQYQDDLLVIVMDQFPIIDIELQLQDFFEKNGNSNAKKDSFFSGVIDQLAENEKDDFIEKAAYMDIGARTASSNVKEMRTSNLPGKMSKSTSSNHGEDAMNMLVSAGLTYMYPGVGTALKLLDQYNSLELLIDEQNEINKEMNYLTGQIIEMENLIQRSRKNLGVTKAETEMAILMQKAANAQAIGYEAIAKRKLKRMTKTRAKITIRLGYYYYIAEELRAAYYKLDRATQLWFNKSVIEFVKGNYNNIRYAVDQDILLYNWLDQSIETQRANLDSLTYHWIFLNRAINLNCPKCKRGKERVLVQETDPVKLSEIVSESEWKQFKEQQEEGGDINIRFRLNPEKEIINEDFSNVRVVQVRIGGVIKDKISQSLKPLPLRGFFTLIHPGISWVYNNNIPQEDLLLYYENSDISDGYDSQLPSKVENNNWPKLFGETLQNRWNEEGGTAFRPFEGYGLYTIWTLNLKNVERIEQLDDIYLRFAYQFTNDSDYKNYSKPYQAILISKSGLKVIVPYANLKHFKEKEEIKAYLDTLVEKHDIFVSSNIEEPNLSGQ